MIRRRRARVFACGAVCVWLSAVAAHEAFAESSIACASIEGGSGKVIKITGPTTFVLDDGATVVLSEIDVPTPNKVQPSAALAMAALRRRALGKEVTLYFDGAETDRHGRLLAQVVVEGAQEAWLQSALVEEGAAYVDTWPTNRTCARELLQSEAAARAAARGLWADPANRILSADEAGMGEGRFAIIEGVVVGVTRLQSPSRLYIDFGPDWHTDFTIRIEPAAARLFDNAGVDAEDWKGRSVRVRGYVGWRFGPEIEVKNPEQIELIAPTQTEAIAHVARPHSN